MRRKEMTERERLLLTILAGEDTFRSIPVLQYRHPELKVYKLMALAHDMKELVDNGLVTKVVGTSRNETRYRITSEGHQKLILA